MDFCRFWSAVVNRDLLSKAAYFGGRRQLNTVYMYILAHHRGNDCTNEISFGYNYWLTIEGMTSLGALRRINCDKGNNTVVTGTTKMFLRELMS